MNYIVVGHGNMRNNDIDKLNRIVLSYAYEYDEFTVDMLFNYLHDNNIKFKKDMSRKRIGYHLSQNPNLSIIRKGNVNYYRLS